MFVKQQYYYGPSFYALDELTERQLRSVKRMDPWRTTHKTQAGKDTKHGSKKYRTIRSLLEDRTKFAIVGLTNWTNIKPDLSVEALENAGAKHASDMPSLSLKVLHASIEAHCATDFNPYLGKRRKDLYILLLNAYFTATTDLDILARSEPECSAAVQSMIVGEAVEFANPTRDLLLQMATAQLHGEFQYDEFESAVKGLAELWNPAMAALTVGKTFASEQADQRALAFLAQKELT